MVSCRGWLRANNRRSAGCNGEVHLPAHDRQCLGGSADKARPSALPAESGIAVTRPTLTVGTRSPSGEAAVFVLRAGPEARRSLSTTPDDFPSPRHAVRRRTLGRGIWPRSDGVELAVSVSTPYGYPFGY